MNHHPLLQEKSWIPCPVWVRLLCIFYDICFLISLLFIAGFILVLTNHALWSEKVIPLWFNTLYYFFWVMLYYGYFWSKGQTPAMNVWRLHFFNDQSVESARLGRQAINRLSYQQIIIRLLLGLLMPVAWLICFFNQDKKSLLDFGCHTKLVRLR